MIERCARVKATLKCLLNNDSTAVEIGRYVGCINSYNYISYAKHDFNIPIVKYKKKGDKLHKYKILEWGRKFAERMINGDVSAPPLKDINKQTKQINKGDNKNV